jgi:hypothetical protein
VATPTPRPGPTAQARLIAAPGTRSRASIRATPPTTSETTPHSSPESHTLAEDDLVMSVCSCCAVHYSGQALAIVITRKEDERPTHLINRL